MKAIEKAKELSEKVSKEEYNRTVQLIHKDGSVQIFTYSCLVDWKEPDTTPPIIWAIVLTKNHGYYAYPMKELLGVNHLAKVYSINGNAM